MPTLTITKLYDDGVVFTEAQLDASFQSIATFMNSTKLDGDNIQLLAITSGLLAADSVITSKILDANVTTAKIANAAITPVKQSTAVKYQPNFLQNIGLESATASVAADTIKITSADGSDLSATNIGYITLPSATPGLLTTFTLTADVSLTPTLCHWGLGTFGNRTDYRLFVYAINDAGTLRWGLSPIQGLTKILGANDQASQVNNTQVNHVFVSSAISGDSVCMEVGSFLADFNDTGDVWAVQTGVGEIYLGIYDSTATQPWVPTGSWSTNTTYTGFWQKIGTEAEFSVQAALTGAPDAVALSFNLPTGLVINTGKTLSTTNFQVDFKSSGCVFDTSAGPTVWDAHAKENSTTAVYVTYTAASIAQVSSTAPTTFATGDAVSVNFRVPIVDWL